jgi:hypothetical protein
MKNVVSRKVAQSSPKGGKSLISYPSLLCDPRLDRRPKDAKYREAAKFGGSPG